MPSTKDIIRAIPNWASMSADQIRTWLLADAEVRDSTLYTGKHLIENVLTLSEYRKVGNDMETAAAADPVVRDAQRWLGGNGMDFSTDLAQGMIDQLATIFQWDIASPGLRAKLKAVGRPLRTRWTDHGGVDGVPDVASIQAAIDSINAQDWWVAKVATVEASGFASVTAIKAIVNQ